MDPRQTEFGSCSSSAADKEPKDPLVHSDPSIPQLKDENCRNNTSVCCKRRKYTDSFVRLDNTHAQVRRILATGVSYVDPEDMIFRFQQNAFHSRLTVSSVKSQMQESFLWMSDNVLLTFHGREVSRLTLVTHLASIYFHASEKTPQDELWSVVDIVLSWLLLDTSTVIRITNVWSQPSLLTHMLASMELITKLVSTKDDLVQLELDGFRLPASVCEALGTLQPCHKAFALSLSNCFLHDISAFVRGIAQNNGPFRLYLMECFNELAVNILSNLHDNTRLTHLTIDVQDHASFRSCQVPPYMEENAMNRMAASIAANRGLTSLTLFPSVVVGMEWRRILFDAIAQHRGCLSALTLIWLDDLPISWVSSDLSPGSHATALRNMVRSNTSIKSLRTHGMVEDSKFWREEIQPFLSRNLYTHRFATIVGSPSGGLDPPALMAKALARVSDNCRLLYLGLRACPGLVVSSKVVRSDKE